MLRIDLPDLGGSREDIPLLIRHAHHLVAGVAAAREPLPAAVVREILKRPVPPAFDELKEIVRRAPVADRDANEGTALPPDRPSAGSAMN